MSVKIVSGGQTGVDQGALEAAVQLGLGCTFGSEQMYAFSVMCWGGRELRIES